MSSSRQLFLEYPSSPPCHSLIIKISFTLDHERHLHRISKDSRDTCEDEQASERRRGGIKKLVMEAYIEQLLQQLFWLTEDNEEVIKANVKPSKALVMACQLIVDCLVENINKTYLTLFIELFLLFLVF